MGLKKLNAIKATDTEITLATAKDIEDFYAAIKEDEDIILSWEDKGHTEHKLFICEGLFTKLKDGTLTLTAQETKKEDKK